MPGIVRGGRHMFGEFGIAGTLWAPHFAHPGANRADLRSPSRRRGRCRSVPKCTDPPIKALRSGWSAEPDEMVDRKRRIRNAESHPRGRVLATGQHRRDSRHDMPFEQNCLPSFQQVMRIMLK